MSTRSCLGGVIMALLPVLPPACAHAAPALVTAAACERRSVYALAGGAPASPRTVDQVRELVRTAEDAFRRDCPGIVGGGVEWCVVLVPGKRLSQGAKSLGEVPVPPFPPERCHVAGSATLGDDSWLIDHKAAEVCPGCDLWFPYE
jgi:hypothetical protein